MSLSNPRLYASIHVVFMCHFGRRLHGYVLGVGDIQYSPPQDFKQRKLECRVSKRPMAISGTLPRAHLEHCPWTTTSDESFTWLALSWAAMIFAPFQLVMLYGSKQRMKTTTPFGLPHTSESTHRIMLRSVGMGWACLIHFWY